MPLPTVTLSELPRETLLEGPPLPCRRVVMPEHVAGIQGDFVAVGISHRHEHVGR